MNVEGITWHAVVLDPEPFAATRTLLTATLGLTPVVEADGYSMFGMPNGSIVDLISTETAQAMCPSGMNDGIAFGFRVDDIKAASDELEAAGCELLGDIKSSSK